MLAPDGVRLCGRRRAKTTIFLATFGALVMGMLGFSAGASAGVISGHITDQAGGASIAGTCVWAQTPNRALVQQTSTDTAGNYALTLAAGQYKILVVHCPTPFYSSRWYDVVAPSSGGYDFNSADTLNLGAAATLTGIDVALETGWKISGRLTSDGTNGIQGVCVEAVKASDETAVVGGLLPFLTNATGNYTTEPLPPGQYKVHFIDCNQPATYLSEWWNDKSGFASADGITLTANTTNVNAQLAADQQAPDPPTITDTDADSPANDNNPEVKGSGAEAGSTVKIYGDAGCTGAVLGSGSAADFNGATGITATVPGDQTTDLRATATDAASNESGCSAPFQYIEDSTAPADPALASPSHTVGVASNDPTVDVSFTGASDGLSGVDGFSYSWDTSQATVPDTTTDAAGTATGTTSPALGDGSSHYFHLRTRDNAGNWTSTVHLGPFVIDTAALSPPQVLPPFATGVTGERAAALTKCKKKKTAKKRKKCRKRARELPL